MEQRAVLSMPEGTNVAQAAAVEESAATADESNDSHPGDKNKDAAKVGHPESAPKAVGSKAKPVRGKAGKASTKAKNSLKAARVRAKDKKRAAVKRAALTASKQKSSATRPAAASAGMGQ
jgi:hypothetical protein